MFNIFPGLNGVITYIKKGGKEYGEKLKPTVKTDETNIRKSLACQKIRFNWISILQKLVALQFLLTVRTTKLSQFINKK